MAKIRVYELARDLNKTNKELLEKIKNMGIAAKNQMSSLDNESVARIKAEIFGYKNEIETEETRKKPTISDKRKKRATKTLEALINRRKSCITQPDLTEAKKDLKEQSIKISEGDTGYTYEKLFGEYLKGAKRITIQDAFIRTKHQIQNFIRFCELLVKIGDTKQISLITKYKDKNQIETLSMLKNSLIKYGIEFEYEFRETLHDRQIKLDNGWIIEVGRGLDIYQRLENWFSIGSSNFDFRPCKETNVRFAKYKGTYSNHQ